MKKPILFSFLAIAICLIGCDDEDAVVIEPATPITNENNVPNGITSINYAVHVLGVNVTGKKSGLQNATVTIQKDGATETKSVGQDGLAVFSGLKPGIVSGYVDAPGYTNLNFSAELTADYTNIDNNQTEFASSTVYVIAQNAGVKGRIYGDFDLDNNLSFNQAANFQQVKVVVEWAVGGLSAAYPKGSGNGQLTTASFDTTYAIVMSDASGNFSVNNLPGFWNGFIHRYRMEDITVKDSTGANIVFKIGSQAFTLYPGQVVDLGDLEAKP